MTKKITPKRATDEVEIAIERIDGSIKIVARVISGVGSKLVTLISPEIKLTGQTMPHRVAVPGQLPSRKKTAFPVMSRKLKNCPPRRRNLAL